MRMSNKIQQWFLLDEQGILPCTNRMLLIQIEEYPYGKTHFLTKTIITHETSFLNRHSCINYF